MARDIHPCGYTVKPLEDVSTIGGDAALREWLLKKAGAHNLTTLLAHADDGVIWGSVSGGRLALSGDAFGEVSPPLRLQTLQQARLFGPDAEILLWRDGDGAHHARLICDVSEAQEGKWCFDEPQIQWGDHIEEERDGFTLVADGQQGLLHAVPLSGIQAYFDKPEDARSDRWHPLRLSVRHYVAGEGAVAREDDGALVIVQSRLTGLQAVSRGGVR